MVEPIKKVADMIVITLGKIKVEIPGDEFATMEETYDGVSFITKNKKLEVRFYDDYMPSTVKQTIKRPIMNMTGAKVLRISLDRRDANKPTLLEY